MTALPLRGYARADGRKGIRNLLLVVYLVECAHHVAREITRRFESTEVHCIGFGGCYPNAYAQDMLQQLCTHPNVGGALLVSLGCEGFNRPALEEAVRASGRPVHSLVIQQAGGTRSTIQAGADWLSATLPALRAQRAVPMAWHELSVGTICGGSDATSGLTANPAMGIAFDLLVAQGGVGIFEETGELIGMEELMAQRARTPALGDALRASVGKAARYYSTLGYPSFAPGNADGGLTTIEEKSLGAYAKSGQSQIDGLIKPGVRPNAGGLYLLDAPSVPIGTAPTSAQWLPLSDGLGLTLEESMTLQLANVTPGTGVTAGHNPLNSYDLQRVKGHRFRYIVAGGVLASGEVLATVTFPLPFPGAKKPPRITLSPGNQGAVAAGLYAEPLTSGLMIVGYSIRVAYTVPVGARVDVATQVDAYLS
jgi:altronate dehydratase